MASLNDFNWPDDDRKYSQRSRLSVYRRWFQVILAIVFFIVVSHYINAEGKVGDFSRYVVGEGLSVESSWIDYKGIMPAAREQVSATPGFLMPLLGVAVRDFSLATDNKESQSLVIQGEAGQVVSSTAEGTVTYLQETDKGWVIKIDHEEGFQSVYENLAEVSVEQDQEIPAGGALGTVGEAPLIFSLLKDGVPVDPLKWLFWDDLMNT